MRPAAIISLLSEEPHIMVPSRIASLIKIFANHRADPKSAREGVDMCGEDVELEQAELVDGIYHIPITGPIGRGLGKFEKGAGAIDVQDIADDLDAAEESADCRGIILHLDSPGGMYSGTPELADRIMRVEKPVYAFIPGMACSGAYWLAAACDMVFATKSADIGNVGVYCYMLDESKRFEADGVSPILVTSGEYKGMGSPGISLNKVQLAHLQSRVNEMASTFNQHVQTRRPDVSLDDLQGQCFKAPSALAKGFIDMIVNSIDEVEALI